jgi:hypothetical protein
VYDGGAGRKKHRWNNPFPGFEQLAGGVWVGKCPSDVTNEEAERLLNEGVAESSGLSEDPNDCPDVIFLIRGTWVYRAYPTQPGVSYHAFPACPRDLKRLPKSIRLKILELANRKGCGEHVRRVLGLKR